MDQEPSVNPQTTRQQNTPPFTPQNSEQTQPIITPEVGQPIPTQTVITPPPNQYPQTENKKSHTKIIVTAVVLLLIVAALSGWFYIKNRNTNTTTVAVTTNVKNLNTNVVMANNGFGVNVFNQLAQQMPKDNIFISPASIAMALSMVYNGAGGNTQTTMQQTLGYQGLDLNTVNKSNLALLSTIKNPDPEVTLAIANSAWLKQGVTINKMFLNTVQEDYQAKATSLNFNDPSAPTTINNWVSNATKGKIPAIVNQIPPDEVFYLINAVYFKGSWHTAFDPSATQDYPFTTGNGTQVQAHLMSQAGTYNYYQDSSLQSIELPYGKNQRLSMNVYLPTDMAAFLKNLKYGQLTDITKKYAKSKGSILLPKFTLNYGQNLNSVLKNLGMSNAFNDTANFNNVAPNIHISDVEHKTYINVDETGTEAAAATSVGGAAGAVSSGPTGFNMIVNKPFVFTIQDNSTKDILFIGVIQNPK